MNKIEEAAITLAAEAVRIAERDNVCLVCLINRLGIRCDKIVEMGHLRHGQTRPRFDDDAHDDAVDAMALLVDAFTKRN